MGVSDYPDEEDPLPSEKRDLRGIIKSPHQSHRGLVDDGSLLDIMVLWTRKAECRKNNLYYNCYNYNMLNDSTKANMQALVELAIQETNTAYTLSGVQTQLRLVHSFRDETYVEPGFSTALNHVTGTSDGYLDYIHNLRDHNMGCEHDKGTSSACSSNAYNYGYRDPQANFRSVMAYNCASGQCDGNAGGGCTRAQRL